MKKTLSVVLSIMMVIACCSALFTLTAQAAAPGFGWVDGWTSVDGTTKGSWQENKAAEGETAFTFDYACEAQNDAVYIGVKYYGALGGSASNFGNGKGMNIRLWFHDPNGTVAVWQYLMDISWNGAAFVSNFRPNGGSDIVSYGADPGTHYTLNTATTADGADLEVIIPVSEISASADVQVVISVSNNLGATLDTNRCLYHGCAYAVYNPWDSRPEACLYPTKPGFKLENVALGCSYTIPTNANNTYVYGSNNTAAADRAINSTLFTDGEYCTGNTEKTYLANCDTEVIIDLGERLTVYGFGAYATEGVWGVWLSHQLRIAYSDDGVNFTALTNGNNAAADARLFNENIGTVSGWTQNYTSVFASCAIAARYIKFTIPKGGYVWHDELTVLGQARPAILRPTHIGSYSAANMPLIPWTVAGSMQELIDNDNLTYVVEGYMSWADLGVFTWDNASKCYRMTEFISGLSGATKKDVVIPEYAFIAAVASYNNPNVAFLRGLELGDPVYVYGTALDTFTLYNWGEALNDSVTISDMPLDETIYGERYAPVATFSADGDFTDDVWEGAQWTEIGKDDGSYQQKSEVPDENKFALRYIMTDDGEYLYVGVETEAEASQIRLWFRTVDGYTLFSHAIDMCPGLESSGLRANPSPTANALAGVAYTSLSSWCETAEGKTVCEYRVKLSDVSLTGVPAQEQFYLCAYDGTVTHYFPAIPYDSANERFPWKSWYVPECTMNGLLPVTNGWIHSNSNVGTATAAYGDDNEFILTVKANSPYVTYYYPETERVTASISNYLLCGRVKVEGGDDAGAAVEVFFADASGNYHSFLLGETVFGDLIDFTADGIIPAGEFEFSTNLSTVVGSSVFPSDAVIRDSDLVFAGLRVYSIGGATVTLYSLGLDNAGYVVEFIDFDGTVISSDTYQFGDDIVVPDDPARDADETYTYVFAGWDPEVVAICDGNATYIATYTVTFVEYTVTFLNYDGSVIDESTYHYGDEITVPADPARPADDNYTYEFAGWDPAVPKACESNAAYTATYTPTFIEYTVRFLDHDGTVISSVNYHYGDEIAVPDDPVRPDDDEHTYEFAGWDPAVVTTCYGSADYTATYNAYQKSVPVTVGVDIANGVGEDKVSVIFGEGTVAASVEAVKPAEYVRGDANGDGEIKAADYLMVKRIVLETYDPNDGERLRADADGNGSVEAIDYIMIKRQVLGTYEIPQPAIGFDDDLSDYAVITVDAEGKVVSVNAEIGAAKADTAIPYGGYAIVIHKNVLDANADLAEAIEALAAGDAAVLSGVEFAALAGQYNAALENATFTVG